MTTRNLLTSGGNTTHACRRGLSKRQSIWEGMAACFDFWGIRTYYVPPFEMPVSHSGREFDRLAENFERIGARLKVVVLNFDKEHGRSK